MNADAPRYALCENEDCKKGFEGEGRFCPGCEVNERVEREYERARRAREEREQAQAAAAFGDHDAALDACWGAGR